MVGRPSKKAGLSALLGCYLVVFSMTFSSWVSAEHPSRPRRRHHRYLKGRGQRVEGKSIYFFVIISKRKRKT